MKRNGLLLTTYTVYCEYCEGSLAVEGAGLALNPTVANFERSGWSKSTYGWCCPNHLDKVSEPFKVQLAKEKAKKHAKM
jgi:hypothetical protein